MKRAKKEKKHSRVVPLHRINSAPCELVDFIAKLEEKLPYLLYVVHRTAQWGTGNVMRKVVLENSFGVGIVCLIAPPNLAQAKERSAGNIGLHGIHCGAKVGKRRCMDSGGFATKRLGSVQLGLDLTEN